MLVSATNIFATIPLSLFVALCIIAFTLLMWGVGRNWERNLKYPKTYSKKEEPKISCVIASYNSADTIRETVESALDSDYSNMDIIVVDDTPNDSVVKALEGLDVKIVRNKKRCGKAKSLNMAIENMETDLFLFLDSDSIIGKKFVSNLASWFRDEKIAAASPKFDTKNRHTFIGKMTSIESSFWFTLARSHMYFGSMVSFRGCGVMIRASTMKEIGYWDETLVEDMALAGKILLKGYVIAHDPRTTVFTDEPENLKGLYRQRFRWGKGGLFAFIRNRKAYTRMRQVTIGMVPHALLIMILMGLIIRNSLTAFLAFFPNTTVLIMPFEHILELIFLFSVLYASYWIPASIAAIAHTIVFSYKGIKSGREILLFVPYVIIFMPILFGIYALGILAGIKHKIKYGKNANEMDFGDWKPTK